MKVYSRIKRIDKKWGAKWTEQRPMDSIDREMNFSSMQRIILFQSSPGKKWAIFIDNDLLITV